MNRYLGIQALRYIAAILVVISHTTQAFNIHITKLGPDIYWHTGTVGVDIFFVISGFVMYTSSEALPDGRHSSLTFLIKRLIRIVPLYWIALLVKLAIIMVAPLAAVGNTIDFKHLMASFFFVPWVSPRGDTVPFVPVGWTLNLEMMFYAFCAASILMGGRRLLTIFTLLAAIYLASKVDHNTLFTFWGNPIILEFGFGLLLGRHRKSIQQIPNWLGLCSIATGCLAIFWFMPHLSFSRPIEWGIPSLLIVMGTISIEKLIVKFKYIGTLENMGAASYSIYLLHTMAIPAISQLFSRLHMDSEALLILVAIGSSAVIGILSYKLLESPLSTYLNKAVKPHLRTS